MFDINLIIIFSAIGGFFIAVYIRHKKKYGKHLVCPIGSNCDLVVHSKYSKFLGIPVEFMGIFYYGLITTIYFVITLTSLTISPLLFFSVLLASLAAFLFSVYLTFIQLFSLKQLCTWCIVSAGLSTLIFFLAITGSLSVFIKILSEYRQYITMFHVLGLALGIGGATITDIFFFKFLKDFRISEFEAEVLNVLSQVIWFALGLLVITGIGLYFPELERLNESPKFLVKMIIVAVIVGNGSLLNLLIAPKLIKISFGEKHEHQTGELHSERKIAFSLGAISIVSWYSALLLGMFRSIPLDFKQLLFLYLTIIALAIGLSQIFERILEKRSKIN
ncbi:MAG: hypothetical protein COV30_00290 [Candidatus Yanofskybacteria bacterium CG10_big_fil_rev_8_21_14_0_10_37_15]|uniref:Vitamin K epoxide reductase domain-containing protein n=1 Tax=Candidatus Yanofskybacteria bacterium CG10_big_fil_rev_8_21_14_0_10_37_15 TaxID=1975097 RepID=A0A2H0R6E7_9BACT|nr:MAG: hypothetical protein COV30_00290 [Candidatus Yanofskybacteria bacterium CG10_big_fil_rev_8_21_14_0_10_37_15]